MQTYTAKDTTPSSNISSQLQSDISVIQLQP